MLRQIELFISWFLHQTTTVSGLLLSAACCLSLDSYIKPQLSTCRITTMQCCLSLDSYIKPQQACVSTSRRGVVYLLIPTSNHNWKCLEVTVRQLFISWFLHQTTTVFYNTTQCHLLFISWFLHQTTTIRLCVCVIPRLFISWFLHQTTTFLVTGLTRLTLFISWFLHQTTTASNTASIRRQLFISWFLHQTTTAERVQQSC